MMNEANNGAPKMESKIVLTARDIFRELKYITDDYLSGIIDYETMDSMNRKAWDYARLHCLDVEVHAMLRKKR